MTVHIEELAKALLQITEGGAAEPSATRYWGLRYNSTGVPGAGAELSASGYARVSMTSSTFWTATVTSAGDPCQVNAADLTFGTPTGVDWGYVNELCLYDGASDTEPRMVFDIYDSTGTGLKYLRDGVEVKFAAGEIVLFAAASN